MSIEMLQLISVVLYVLAGALLLVGVVLFITLKIPKVIGDLSGATAKKAIENIRQQNLTVSDQLSKGNDPHATAKKATEKISRSGRLLMRDRNSVDGIGTQKLSANMIDQTAGETVLLQNRASEETTLLSNVIKIPEEKQYFANETTLLSPNLEKANFSVEMEIKFIGSSELIE